FLSRTAINDRGYNASSNSSTGGQEQNRFLSPYTLSILAAAGQNLCSRVHGAGNAAFLREEGRSHFSEAICHAVCGAFFKGLFSRSIFPRATAWISAWIEIIASQKRPRSF